MSLAAKLRGVFVVFAALLVVVVVFHRRTIRSTIDSGRALAAISDRHRVASNIQPIRLTEMSASARKFLVTRDRGYIDKMAATAGLFDQEMRSLRTQALTPLESERLTSLEKAWYDVSHSLRVAGDSTGSTRAVMSTTMRGLDSLLARAAVHAAGLAEASRLAMMAELSSAERVGSASERLSLTVSLLVLVLGALVSTILVRSILIPLKRLADGTRAIAEGHLGHRLPDDAQDELGQVSRSFNAMSDRLAVLDRLKRDFVSNVSHDLKTPLSSMQETTDALLDGLAGPLTHKQRELLTLNQDGGRRLSSMIGKLLDLSRLESRPAPEAELMDLSGLVRRAVDHVNALRSGRDGVSVAFTGGDQRVLLRADAEGIAQVLDNLLENAMKFSPPGGRVHVTLGAHDDGCALLSIADEGPGIPDAEKERVFERFYQTHDGRSMQSRGVGLGLSICRHIIAAHGGSIAVRNNTPVGSVFEARFPGAMVVPAVAGMSGLDVLAGAIA
jgi:signal transduction histidine kinase